MNFFKRGTEMKFHGRPLAGIAMLLVGAALTFAQSPASTLVGAVTDSSGAIVPGASITVRSVSTNEARRVVSNAAGNFTVPSLAPGQYDVVVEKEGFRKVVQSGLILEVDHTERLAVVLQVGAVSEVVEVIAAAPLLNTENATKGDVIVNNEIVDVPLNGRDFSDLALLVPGVQPQAQGGQGSGFVVNGARGDSTNFILDGFDDVSRRSGAIQSQPPLEAMQEFKMQTTGYPAEYGRLGGGVMSMVLKTGGNQLHGSLFEFLRNDKLDGRNFFDQEKSEERRNQFGGMLSGPVYIPKVYDGRNRTFFLGSWESFREIQGQSKLTTVPTPEQLSGDFSQSGVKITDPLTKKPFLGNQILPGRMDPIAVQVAKYFPPPNLFQPGQPNNYFNNLGNPNYWDTYLAKIDHRLTQSDTVSFRFMTRSNDNPDPFRGGPSGQFGAQVKDTASLFGLSYTRIFGPTLVNEFRTGLSRSTHLEQNNDAGQNFAAQFGLIGTTSDPFLTGFPRFTLKGLGALGDGPAQPSKFTINNIQWTDTVTWIKSNHMVKFGADIVREQFFQPYYNNNRGTFNFQGKWTGSPIADFLLGMPNSTSRQLGVNPNYLFATALGFFVQDDYKVLRNLTVSVGLRYEILGPPSEKYGRIADFVPSLGKLIVASTDTLPDLASLEAAGGLTGLVATAKDYGLPKSLVSTNYKNLAPRAGFAWRPSGGTKTVVRGGYGIFYTGLLLNPIRASLGNQFPFTISETYSQIASQPTYLTLQNPFPSSATNVFTGVNNVGGFASLNPPTSYLQSWNLTLERELGWGAGIEVGYIGSKGTHLGQQYNANMPYLAGAALTKPFPAFSTVNVFDFGANSTYHSGTVTLRKRFGAGVFYRLNYVYGKSLDDASQLNASSAGGYAGALDPRNLALEHARSDFDRRHTFSMVLLYDLPFRRHWYSRGWQISGSGQVYSGQPFTPQLSSADPNLGESGRPNRVANGSLANPTPLMWFNMGAFTVPDGTLLGNSGRNILEGPGMIQVNCAVIRSFKIGERGAIQFRGEAFNAMNHANFMLPNTSVDSANGGVITRAQDPRQIQFGLRYSF